MFSIAQGRPTGLLRWLLRQPIKLYHAGLGGLLASRFLLLKHTGRKTGMLRETVLEIAGFDKANDTYYVASGFGPTSDWYLNLGENPHCFVQVGRREMSARAQQLSSLESGDRMVGYARQYPFAARELCRILGVPTDGSESSYRRMGEEQVPFVALWVQRTIRSDAGIWPGWLFMLAAGVMLFWWRRRDT